MSIRDIVALILGSDPEMSPEYEQAMDRANMAMVEYLQKIDAGVVPTPEESAGLLNDNWAVYLYAVNEGDTTIAKRTAMFVADVAKQLRTIGYNVWFEDRYIVTPGE